MSKVWLAPLMVMMTSSVPLRRRLNTSGAFRAARHEHVGLDDGEEAARFERFGDADPNAMIGFRYHAMAKQSFLHDESSRVLRWRQHRGGCAR
jgi:hypothetical protein